MISNLNVFSRSKKNAMSLRSLTRKMIWLQLTRSPNTKCQKKAPNSKLESPITPVTNYFNIRVNSQVEARLKTSSSIASRINQRGAKPTELPFFLN